MHQPHPRRPHLHSSMHQVSRSVNARVSCTAEMQPCTVGILLNDFLLVVHGIYGILVQYVMDART